jgi:hypothetical protein
MCANKFLNWKYLRLDAVIYKILFAQLILTLSITKMYQLVKIFRDEYNIKQISI